MKLRVAGAILLAAGGAWLWGCNHRPRALQSPESAPSDPASDPGTSSPEPDCDAAFDELLEVMEFRHEEDLRTMREQRSGFLLRCQAAGPEGPPCVPDTLEQHGKWWKRVEEETCKEAKAADLACDEPAPAPRLPIFLWPPTLACVQRAVYEQAIASGQVARLLDDIGSGEVEIDSHGLAKLPAKYEILTADGTVRASVKDGVVRAFLILQRGRHQNALGLILGNTPIEDSELHAHNDCGGEGIRIGGLVYTAGDRLDAHTIEASYGCD